MEKRNGFFKTIIENMWIFMVYALGIIVQLFLIYQQEEMEQNSVNLVITVVFFAVILILFIIANHCQRKSLKFRDDLQKVDNHIHELLDAGITNIQDKLFEENLFADANLKAAFEEYKCDSIKMKNVAEDADVDIENYINHQLMEDSMGMHFLNQISGALTGLGILGTFIGLALGLSHFNFTGGDISKEIQPLMDGIKVAFHTSIIGLVYSLIYGFLYNKQLSGERQVLEQFLSDYRKYVVSVTEAGSTETMVKYQQKMVELLSAQISNQQSDADIYQKMLVEQTRLNNLTETINRQNVESITSSIENTIVPEIKIMARSLEEFADKTHKDQKEELEKLVNNFISQMNQSLGDSFATLGKVVNETTEWQKHMLGELQAVLKQINDMAIDLATINQSIEKSVDKVSSYTEKVEEMQTEINTGLGKLSAQNEKNTELCLNANEKLQMFREENSVVTDRMNSFLGEAEKQANTIQEMNKTFFDNSVQAVDGMSILSTEVATNIGRTAEASMDNMTSTNIVVVSALQTMVEKLITHLQELNTKVEKHSADSIRNIEAQSAIAIQNVAGFSETASKDLRDQAEQHLNSVHEIGTTNRDNLASAYTELTSLIKTDKEELTRQAAEAIQSVANLSETTTKDLRDQAEQHLNSVHKVGTTNRDNLASAYTELTGLIKTDKEELTRQATEAIQSVANLSETTTKDLRDQAEQHLNSVHEIGTTNRDNLASAYTELTSLIKTDKEELTRQATEAIQNVANVSVSTTTDIRNQAEQHMEAVQRISTENKDNLADTYEKLASELNGRIDRIEKELSSAIENIASLSAETASDLRRQTEYHITAIESISDSNRRNLENAFNDMEQILSTKLQYLTDMKDVLSDDLTSATKAMTNAAAGLNDDMVKQINGALEAFDINLAKATSHLSGTIRDMDDTTGKVPMVISQTYFNLEKSFKEMQQMLDQYLEYADKLHHNLELKLKQLERENRA